MSEEFTTVNVEPATPTPEPTVPTVIPPAPAAEDQNAPPAEVPAEEETTEQLEEKKQSKWQRRIERQKTARIQAETENRLLREQLAKFDAQSKPQGDEEPKRDDFEDYGEYVRAAARWDAKQIARESLKAERDAQSGRERQSQAAAGNEKVAKAWAESEKTFKAATKDYDTVVGHFADDELQALAPQTRMAIVESDVGPALLYHLATHPEIAERIADLSPVRQIAELGKLESSVSMPVKKTTNAPAPANTTTGGRTASQDLSKLTQEEYEAKRKSQGARWAR